MLEILLILKKFHISHRDLKPDNILFTSNNEICLIDFGLATFYNIETYIHYKCGTPGYIAPEILNMNGKQAYSCQCDMFSLGAILYNLYKFLFKI